MSQNFPLTSGTGGTVPLPPIENGDELIGPGLQALLANLDDPLFGQDPGGRILYASPAAIQFYERSPDDILGRSALDFIPESHRGDHRRLLEQVHDTGRTIALMSERLDRNGEVVPVYVKAYDVAGRVIGVIEHVLTQDRKGELRMVRAYRESEQLLASISSALIGIDRQDVVRRWAGAAETLFGIAADRVIGTPFLNCPIDWDWAEILERIAESREQDVPVRWEDVRYRQPDGQDGYISVTISPLLDALGNGNGHILVATDRTHAHKLEKQLANSRKLESIGRLSAGIAHEINTPIQYIGENLRFLSHGLQEMTQLLEALRSSPDERERERVRDSRWRFLEAEMPLALEESLKGIEQVTAIVSAMRAFSHLGRDDFAPTDINRTLRDTVTVARNEWKYVADIDLDLDGDLPEVVCVANELRQVFINILINAAHTIEEKHGDGGKGRIGIRSRRDGADGVVVTIADDGMGIPDAIRHKVFDPFFTTKPVGKGTGQGLTLVYSVVVEKLGGKLDIESVPDRGTAIHIHLPVTGRTGRGV